MIIVFFIVQLIRDRRGRVVVVEVFDKDVDVNWMRHLR